MDCEERPAYPLPQGWVELIDHLEYDHDADASVIDRLDSDDLRARHAHAHMTAKFQSGHRHRHPEWGQT